MEAFVRRIFEGIDQVVSIFRRFVGRISPASSIGDYAKWKGITGQHLARKSLVKPNFMGHSPKDSDREIRMRVLVRAVDESLRR